MTYREKHRPEETEIEIEIEKDNEDEHETQTDRGREFKTRFFTMISFQKSNPWSLFTDNEMKRVSGVERGSERGRGSRIGQMSTDNQDKQIYSKRPTVQTRRS